MGGLNFATCAEGSIEKNELPEGMLTNRANQAMFGFAETVLPQTHSDRRVKKVVITVSVTSPLKEFLEMPDTASRSVFVAKHPHPFLVARGTQKSPGDASDIFTSSALSTTMVQEVLAAQRRLLCQNKTSVPRSAQDLPAQCCHDAG